MNTTCNCHGKCAHRGFGMFILRIVAGLIFALHGYQKFMNMDGTRAFFASLHLWPWLATAIAVVELLGGIALILGLWTCFFTPLLAIDVAVAIVLVTWRHGGFMGSQTELLLLASMLAIKHSGRGSWGLGRRCGCMMCGYARGPKVCENCGHDPKMGNECGCDCHK